MVRTMLLLCFVSKNMKQRSETSEPCLIDSGLVLGFGGRMYVVLELRTSSLFFNRFLFSCYKKINLFGKIEIVVSVSIFHFLVTLSFFLKII